jgi:glycogen operon protein
MAETNSALLRFFKELISLRKRHEVFRRPDFFPGPRNGSVSDISWQSTRRGHEDWSSSAKTLAYFLNGRLAGQPRDDDFFVMLNGHRQDPADFEMPALPKGRSWRRIIDSAAAAPDDIMDETQATAAKETVRVLPMAAVVLISKPTGKSKA